MGETTSRIPWIMPQERHVNSFAMAKNAPLCIDVGPGRQPSIRYATAAALDAHRKIIAELYVDEDRKLAEVMTEMERTYRLKAT